MNAARRDLSNGISLDRFGEDEKSDAPAVVLAVDHGGVIYELLRSKAREGGRSGVGFASAERKNGENQPQVDAQPSPTVAELRMVEKQREERAPLSGSRVSEWREGNRMGVRER